MSIVAESSFPVVSNHRHTVPSLRGQATLEALLSFLATLSMISILMMALSIQGKEAREKGMEFERIMISEAVARAVEASFYAGGDISMDFNKEGIAYSIEHGRFHVVHGSGVIEIGGVFLYDGSEPL